MLNLQSDIDIRLLRVFVAVAQAKGITAAQITLGLSQSAISTHLSTLETRLGYSLCSRGRSGFSLTEKGMSVLEAAQDLLGSFRDFSSLTQSLKGRLGGTINFAIVDSLYSLPNQPLSKAISNFYQRDQNIVLNFYVYSSNGIECGLLNHEIDIGIGYFGEHQAGLRYDSWHNEQQLVCCGQEHPLFQCNATDNDLLEQQWVHRNYALPTIQHFPINQLKHNAITNYMEAVVHLILAGTHIGHLPSHFANQFVEKGLMKVLSTDALNYQTSLSIAYRSNKRTDALDALLIDLLKYTE